MPALIESTSPGWLHPTRSDLATSPDWCRSRFDPEARTREAGGDALGPTQPHPALRWWPPRPTSTGPPGTRPSATTPTLDPLHLAEVAASHPLRSHHHPEVEWIKLGDATTSPSWCRESTPARARGAMRCCMPVLEARERGEVRAREAGRMPQSGRPATTRHLMRRHGHPTHLDRPARPSRSLPATNPPLIDSTPPKWLHPTHADATTSPKWRGSRKGVPPPPGTGVDQARRMPPRAPKWRGSGRRKPPRAPKRRGSGRWDAATSPKWRRSGRRRPSK